SNSDCIMKLADKMKGASFITVFYGDGVRSEDADAVCEMLRGEVPEAEFTLLYGGQPLYDYIISAE
ncbi:MAG: DAK2 domain-containing protein, partial [Eubacteriales bacterium]